MCQRLENWPKKKRGGGHKLIMGKNSKQKRPPLYLKKRPNCFTKLSGEYWQKNLLDGRLTKGEKKKNGKNDLKKRPLSN